MKSPKKPKRGKAPKKPKRSASISAWEAYDRRFKEWQKREKEKISTYLRKVAEIKNLKKKKEQLINKYASKKPLAFMKVA